MKTDEEKKAYRVAYRLANKEKLKIKDKLYNEKNKEKIRLVQKKYYVSNKSKIDLLNKKWRLDNSECIAERARQYYIDNKETLQYKYLVENGRLKKYNLTIHTYLELLVSQDHKCSICEIDLVDLPKNDVHIDHCHEKGIVRGVLCRGCNTGLGMFKDNKTALLAAVAYLEKHDAKN